MLRGTKVLLLSFLFAVFLFFVNVMLLDGFLSNFTSAVGMDPSSSFYVGPQMSDLALFISFMPGLSIVLGIGYFMFDRVFGQESTDWLR